MLSFHPFSSFVLLLQFLGQIWRTVTVKDPAHWFSLLSDAALNVSTLRLCTDDILEAVYTKVYDNAVKGTKTNVFIAACTTCHARLKLYESLDILQEQFLYYDTDSVV